MWVTTVSYRFKKYIFCIHPDNEAKEAGDCTFWHPKLGAENFSSSKTHNFAVEKLTCIHFIFQNKEFFLTQGPTDIFLSLSFYCNTAHAIKANIFGIANQKETQTNY